jgi:hypothetical protein
MFEFRFELFCGQSVSRPVCLGVGSPSGAHDQIFITAGHLRSSCCGAPSLTSGQVRNLLVQFAVTLGPKSRRTHDHMLLTHLRLPQPGVPGSRMYITQEQGGPVIPPSTGLKYFIQPGGNTLHLHYRAQPVMLFVEAVAVYCENHTEHTDTVHTSQETHYVSATEPNRLILFGETDAVYCEKHTEHTDTVRTSQETHYVSATSPTG